MKFSPAGGLYQCKRGFDTRDKRQVILKEFDPATGETRIVFYHDCPIEEISSDTEKVTYNLDRARVVTWSGSSVGKQSMPLSRGGWS